MSRVEVTTDVCIISMNVMGQMQKRHDRNGKVCNKVVMKWSIEKSRSFGLQGWFPEREKCSGAPLYVADIMYWSYTALNEHDGSQSLWRIACAK